MFKQTTGTVDGVSSSQLTYY